MVDSDVWVRVSIASQSLELMRGNVLQQRWSVSTAKKGAGEQSGSEKTPRGWHRIRAKIGGSQPSASVFIGRRPTGEIHTPELHAANPERDWILSRILWLCGEERGCNRSGCVDSQRRYIYIHGTPEQFPMGEPLSHGCIRMRNADVIELFDKVAAGTRLLITED